jgi:hypothetical protein
MTTFVYTVLAHPDDDLLELEPCPVCVVTEPMWAELAVQIARQPTNIPYPAATLARRCEEGYAAAAVFKGQIVSHVALVPVGCRIACPDVPHTWAGFCAAAGLSAARLPSVDVYEFASGWTAPAWRCRRINMALRKPLVARYLGDQCLGVGGMAGLAQPLLARLGWQILGWSAAPYVSSLIGMPLAGLEDRAAAGWRPPAGMAPYDGPPIELDDPCHPWSQFCYLWVSNRALACELDAQLAEVCQGDLRRWQLAVVDVFNQPGALATLAWLP